MADPSATGSPFLRESAPFLKRKGIIWISMKTVTRLCCHYGNTMFFHMEKMINIILSTEHFQLLVGSWNGFWSSFEQTAAPTLHKCEGVSAKDMISKNRSSLPQWFMCCQSNGLDILNTVSSNAPLTKRKKKNEDTHSPRSDNICLIALHNMTCDACTVLCVALSMKKCFEGAYIIFCMTR